MSWGRAAWQIWAFALGSALLAGCETPPPPLPPTETVGNYHLDTGDTVRVIVYNQTSLSNDFIVADDGTISLPMAGSIKARGETVQQLEKDIYNKLNQGILVNPGVSVQLAQTRPVFVVGEVSKPGQYAFVSNLNVLGAVAAAGGFTVRANREQVTVVRAVKDHPSLEWSADVLANLQPGDVIVVREQIF